MKVKEAAGLLGVSRQRIHQLVRSGCMQGTQYPCGCWILDDASVEKYRDSIRPRLEALDVKYGEARKKILESAKE